MNRFNHSPLLGRMREKGFTQKDLAKEIGISEVALWKKLHGKTDFTTTEIFTIAKVLDIENLWVYFFAL